MRGVLTDQVPIGFEVDGQVVDVRVRSSNRARAMRITIGPRRALDVVVPTGTPEERIRGFLRQKRSWIDPMWCGSTAIQSVLNPSTEVAQWLGRIGTTGSSSVGLPSSIPRRWSAGIDGKLVVG